MPKRESGIRPKGNRWEVRLRTGAGRRIEQRLPPGATYDDAKALKAALQRRLIESATGRVDYTLIEVLDRWQPDAERLRSWERDLRYRAGVVRDTVGHYRLSQITEAADLLKRRGSRAQLSAAGVNRYLAILKRLGTLAFKWGWVAQPVASRIELLPGEQRRTQYATPAQLRTLMAAADHRLRAAMLLAALTGLRKGELLQITPAMVDGHTLVLPPQITKTNKARVVPLPAEARKVPLPISLSGPNLRKLWDEARKATGMQWLRWHDLRRSYGTWLLQSGASLADARDLLGHGDVKTTSIYLATARQDLAKAVAKLPKVGKKVGERRGKTRARSDSKKAA
jgi:integrase